MFDVNQFKRDVKDWIKSHPDGAESDLTDFCEELIPPNQFAMNGWLVEQTISWYKHLLARREITRRYENDGGEDN